MSLENEKSRKPSRYLNGEGGPAASSNRQLGAVDSGGVSEGDSGPKGYQGKLGELEPRGADASTGGTRKSYFQDPWAGSSSRSPP